MYIAGRREAAIPQKNIDGANLLLAYQPFLVPFLGFSEKLSTESRERVQKLQSHVQNVSENFH